MQLNLSRINISQFEVELERSISEGRKKVREWKSSTSSGKELPLPDRIPATWEAANFGKEVMTPWMKPEKMVHREWLLFPSKKRCWHQIALEPRLNNFFDWITQLEIGRKFRSWGENQKKLGKDENSIEEQCSRTWNEKTRRWYKR